MRNLSALLASLRMRLITISRYPGQFLLDIVIPVVFAAMPIMLGRANGDAAGEAFARNTGTANYVAYILIGSSVFSIVSLAFWHVAYWLRWEQETGTLEAIYLTPTHRMWIVGGTVVYSILRSLIAAFGAFFIGAWVFRVNPLQGELGLALLFIAVGLAPVYGLALFFGALILKVKEANSLVGLMQWGVSFLMGVFFPVTVFPPLVKTLALLFPPTWMTNGVRSALLGVGYFFGEWYLDFAVLWVFLLITPLAGYWIFSQAEWSVKRNEGFGQF
jgi:ABC-2 type transport system permease protein